ncbi:MAG: phosphoribosylglycinamide formyltransferase [Bacteroidetes bacterium]|nr:phosphoribosylglycinamide formyltransferase [Bacteroidota bacterium]
MNKVRLAIFASGAGSNAINVINFFSNSQTIEVAAVFSNKKEAQVLTSAASLGVTTFVMSNEQAEDASFLIQACDSLGVDSILLAGYLRKIPSAFVQHFPKRIINIHPSLLPKYGGKGMYGMKVHEAVKSANESETGISIHWVNEHFDEGGIIAQFHTAISTQDTPESIAAKVQKLEHAFLPAVLNHYLTTPLS